MQDDNPIVPADILDEYNPSATDYIWTEDVSDVGQDDEDIHAELLAVEEAKEFFKRGDHRNALDQLGLASALAECQTPSRLLLSAKCHLALGE